MQDTQNDLPICGSLRLNCDWIHTQGLCRCNTGANCPYMISNESDMIRVSMENMREMYDQLQQIYRLLHDLQQHQR